MTHAYSESYLSNIKAKDDSVQDFPAFEVGK